MNPPGHAIVLHRFERPAESVFDAWLDSVQLGRWMFGPSVRDERVVRLTLEPRVGGRFSFLLERAGAEVEYVGEFLAIDRPRLLAFTWGSRASLPETTRVVVEITPQETGCEVKLTHVVGAQWSAIVDQAASLWSKMLDNLARVLG